MRVAAIVVAAGRGERLGAGVPKQLVEIGGRTILQRSVDAFVSHPRIARVVVVLPADLVARPPLRPSPPFPAPLIVAGGPRRQDSVANGVAALDGSDDVVVIHDAARPFVTAAVIDRTIDAAAAHGAAIAAVPARDTVKEAAPDGSVARTLPRERIFLAQTPQAFRRDVLQQALALGQAGVEATDEAALAELAGHPVRLVEGASANLKVTTPDDLAFGRGLVMAEEAAGGNIRVGLGYDLHRLVEGRPFILGGVAIPFDRGPAGHSDADVLAHAITDAVLGAASAGDIGRHFPDTDPQWQGASSLDLLGRALGIVRRAGFRLVNVDAVVIAERPKLAQHVGAIAERLARTLDIPPDAVSLKGKTNEGLGAIGRGEAIAAHAVALLVRY
jgi:2-C-methyl-D-erythritol 4-phosphate cytidylyltransferase/2-C-methyl-D-erythritol 2,4-cyclodiphosphate synthase